MSESIIIPSSGTADVLPDSRCRRPMETKFVNGMAYEQVFCMNCHKFTGVWVPQENCDFVGYICNPCAEDAEVNRVFGAYMIPDELFWMQLKAAQMEEFGRELLPHEMAEVLANDGTTNAMKLLKREADERHRIASTRS